MTLNLSSVAPAVTLPTPDGVMALAARSLACDSGAAFQSLLVAAHEALGRLTGTVHEAETAALSLSQREHAHEIVQDLDATRDALAAGLAENARCLRTDAPSLPSALRALLRPDRQRLTDAARAVRDAWRESRHEASGASNWFAAASHAVEALGETATHLRRLAAVQPETSAARELATGVADVLVASRDVILADIERLVD